MAKISAMRKDAARLPAYKRELAKLRREIAELKKQLKAATDK